MGKRLLHLMLVAVLMITLLPTIPVQAADNAGESYFIWDNVPTSVNTERISLSGRLDQVAASGITYTVEQISDNNEMLQKREKSAIGITVSPDGKRINVVNLQLFPGKNRITFYGKRGSSEISKPLPIITYIDAPILHDLQFVGGTTPKRLNDAAETVVTNANSNISSQSLFTIEGYAPNAREVIVEYGDNKSNSGIVREDGSNYFVISQIKLSKGKNTLKFRVKNATQNIEVTRDVIYFDDSVTFYDVNMKYEDSALPFKEEKALNQLPEFFAPASPDKDKFSISGRVIVPNDFSSNNVGEMRIEAAYRLAVDGAGSNEDATGTPLADPKIEPDHNDKIVVRFSQEVNNPPTTLSGLLNMIDFQVPVIPAGNTVYRSVNEDLTTSTVNWRINPETGGSEMVLSISKEDAPKLKDVRQIVLRDNVTAKQDLNKFIDVMAYNREIVKGDDGLKEENTITVNPGTVTAGGQLQIQVTKAGTPPTPFTMPIITMAGWETAADIADEIVNQLGTALAGHYTVALQAPGSNKVIIRKDVADALNTTIVFSTNTTGVAITSSRTVVGADPVKEEQEITVPPTSGVTKSTPINIYFNDGTHNKKWSTTLSSSDNTPEKVLSRIHLAMSGDTDITTDYDIDPIGPNDTSFNIKRKNAGVVNISFWVDGPYPFTKIVPLAGSFDHTKPFVREAYVKGSNVAGATRGVDPGEKLIIQFEDLSNELPATQKQLTTASQVNQLLKLTEFDGSTLLGNLGGSNNYSAIYYPATKRLEIIFDSAAGLQTDLTTTRVPDFGVGNKRAVRSEFTPTDLGNGLDFSKVQTTGNVPLLGGSFDANPVIPNPNPELIDTIGDFANVEFLNESLTPLGDKDFTLTKISGQDYSNSAPYYIFEYKIEDMPIPTAFGKQFFVKLVAENTKKTRLNNGFREFEGTGDTDLGYTLVNKDTPYITEMRVNQTISQATSVFDTINKAASTALTDGTEINQTPFAVKLTVKNGWKVPGFNIATDLEVTSQATGSNATPVNVSLDNVTATKSNGDDLELWFWVKKLPFDGSQTLTIKFKSQAEMQVKITYTSGIYVQFDKIVDGLVHRYDPIDEEREKNVVEQILSNFKGTLNNVPDDEIEYSGTNQNVYLYVNNNEVKLKQQPGSLKNKFELDPTADNDNDPQTSINREIWEMLFDGQNTISFLYEKKSGNTTTIKYEKSYIFTLFSLNLPEIPKGDSDSIYPYGTDKNSPVRDSRFTGSNGSYTTKEADMHIYGTFDFIDLGDRDARIRAQLGKIDKGKYMFEIIGPEGKTKLWDLKEHEFVAKNGKKTYNSKDPDGDLSGDLSIIYKEDDQSFEFILKNQKLPSDGTKVVYTFKVYNNGLNGTYATYRLEVGTSGLPYKLIRPLPQQLVPATINQNYLEVILYAENADSVTVNKEEAAKVDFDGNYDGDVDDSTSDYQGAFRAVVKDLKPNKKNKITYTIKRGSDSITDSFEVFYALANIPGAQVLEPLKTGHKVFDGKLNLTFPKNTYLRRVDYNVPENYRTQLFKNHDILFAIANEKDGVVDRYDYVDPKPRGFANLIENLGLRFYSSFDNHFVKASQVYWIDAGMADDPDTQEYDAHSTGMLPHQLPQLKPSLPSFDSVPSNRMLAPTQRGTLELSYDPQTVAAASHHITVMRYDPENRYWENLGGEVNTSKRTIKVPFDKFGYYVVAKMNDSFQDVIIHQYARNHIEAMFSKGVIKPRRSDEFRPDEDTTRGEFTAMIVRALQLQLIEKPEAFSFDDVPTLIDRASLWDYRHIETAARLGIVRGTYPRIFEPSLRISRQDAAVVLARALQLKIDTDPVKVNKDLQKLFKDYNLIDPYARPYVLAIAKKKFIQGSAIDANDPKKGYIFEPKANMLRGDAAILIGRVMADQKKIPKIGEVK